MKDNDVQVGKPETVFKGTKAVIEALTGAEGQIAYATDVDAFGVFNGTIWMWLDDDAGFSILIGDGVNVITTGVKGAIEVPFDCYLEMVTMVSVDNTSGSIIVDMWKDVYANYPPVDADSITSSTPPTITTAVKSQDSTLTTWIRSWTKGDIILFNVDSATSVKLVMLSCQVRRTAV